MSHVGAGTPHRKQQGAFSPTRQRILNDVKRLKRPKLAGIYAIHVNPQHSENVRACTQYMQLLPTNLNSEHDHSSPRAIERVRARQLSLGGLFRALTICRMCGCPMRTTTKAQQHLSSASRPVHATTITRDVPTPIRHINALHTTTHCGNG